MKRKGQKKEALNRREFLKRTGMVSLATVAFPYIIPGRALGLDGSVPPSERITVGCIGLGGMGTSNMDGFLSQPSAQSSRLRCS
jgi:hypothetical protein